jgi:hypothetical protein
MVLELLWLWCSGVESDRLFLLFGLSGEELPLEDAEELVLPLR